MRKIKIRVLFLALLILTISMNATAYAQEDDSEATDLEQATFINNDDQWYDTSEMDQYVDGIYNVGENARANMTGVIRLYQSGTKLACNYSTVYTYSVNKIGVKNIKFQYKGSLGIWHNIITLDDRYRTNAASFMGSFSCDGVVGRTYRVKGTHYIIDDDYSETRNNETEGLTFK